MSCLSILYVGGVIRVYYEHYEFSLKRKKYLYLMTAGLLSVVLIQHLNGTPWMFRSVYGTDMLLFLVGGIAGTIMIYSISRILPTGHIKWLLTLSNGLILILGFQLLALKFYFALPESYKNVFTDYIAALIILLAFIPVIKLAERFFPIILGYRVK